MRKATILLFVLLLALPYIVQAQSLNNDSRVTEAFNLTPSVITNSFPVFP